MSKIALITGSSGGLGKAIASALADAGYRLALHYFRNEEKAQTLLRSLSAKSGAHALFHADLREEVQIEAMVSEIADTMGPVQVLINNAGIPYSGLSWKQPSSEWQHVFSVNTMAPWLLSKHCIPMMREKGVGRIIYMSSVVAHRPPAGTSLYAASKAALEGLTRAQAVELSRFGITVNCIAPGYFDAGMISAVDEDTRRSLLLQTPAGRLGHAAELAAAVLYLCQENAAYTTGQVVHINGGLFI